MADFRIGQRLASGMEPELGIGIVPAFFGPGRRSHLYGRHTGLPPVSW